MNGLKGLTSALLMGLMVFSISGCSGNFIETGVAETISNSVTIPKQYSIVYEVETADGTIFTVEKTKAGEGNIYYKSREKEQLFLAEGTSYVLYEKDEAGIFVASNQGITYNEDYVTSATADFIELTEKSKEKFMPGMKSDGEQEKSGRTCLIYSVSVGTSSTAVTYTLAVDKETGICLGWDETKKVVGNDMAADKDTFTCTQFLIEDIPSLEQLADKSVN